MESKKPEVNPLDVQVGGTHYKDMKLQPIEFIQANNLNFEEGSIIKYICRYKYKGGLNDLEKIKHYADLLINKYKYTTFGEEHESNKS